MHAQVSRMYLVSLPESSRVAMAGAARGLGAKRSAERSVHPPLVSVLKIHTRVPILSLLV